MVKMKVIPTSKDLEKLEKIAEKIKPLTAILTRNSRTIEAITATYGFKKPTKKRRKLPNGRKWKNKKAVYENLNAKTAAENYNANAMIRPLVEKYKKILNKEY